MRYDLDHISHFVGLDGYWGQNARALIGASPCVTDAGDRSSSKVLLLKTSSPTRHLEVIDFNSRSSTGETFSSDFQLFSPTFLLLNPLRHTKNYLQTQSTVLKGRLQLQHADLIIGVFHIVSSQQIALEYMYFFSLLQHAPLKAWGHMKSYSTTPPNHN